MTEKLPTESSQEKEKNYEIMWDSNPHPFISLWRLSILSYKCKTIKGEIFEYLKFLIVWEKKKMDLKNFLKILLSLPLHGLKEEEKNYCTRLISGRQKKIHAWLY